MNGSRRPSVPAEYEEHTERWGWSGYREEVGSRVVDRIQNAGPSLDVLYARAKLLPERSKVDRAHVHHYWHCTFISGLQLSIFVSDFCLNIFTCPTAAATAGMFLPPSIFLST